MQSKNSCSDSEAYQHKSVAKPGERKLVTGVQTEGAKREVPVENVLRV